MDLNGCDVDLKQTQNHSSAETISGVGGQVSAQHWYVAVWKCVIASQRRPELELSLLSVGLTSDIVIYVHQTIASGVDISFPSFGWNR